MGEGGAWHTPKKTAWDACYGSGSKRKIREERNRENTWAQLAILQGAHLEHTDLRRKGDLRPRWKSFMHLQHWMPRKQFEGQ